MQTIESNNISQHLESYEERKSGVVFLVFCIWAFIILCRPQDLFPALASIRPVLVIEVIMLSILVVNYGGINRQSVFKETQVKLYTAFLIIMVIGIPTSLYPGLTFMAIFTQYINVILFFFIFIKVVDTTSKVAQILQIGCLGNCLYSAFILSVGTYQYGRLYFGKMFDPNDLAFFSLAFLPLNLMFINRDNQLWLRLVHIGSFAFGALIILLSGSRGGLLAFGAVILMFLITKTKTVNFSIKIIIITLGLLLFSLAPINWDRYGTILDIEDDYNLSDEMGRISIWKIGMKAMIENPFTGVGVENFYNAVGIDRERRGLESHTWQAAHNMAVQIGAETGIIGLSFFIIMSLNVFIIFRRARKTAISDKLVRIADTGRAGFLGLFIAGMFLSQAYSVYWALYVALSGVVNQLLLNEEKALSPYQPVVDN